MKQKSLILLLVFLPCVFFGCKTKGPAGGINHSKVIPSATLENSPPVPIDSGAMGKRAGRKWLPGEENIQRLADAFATTWKKHGQWGRMLNNQTGDVAEYNTSGGVVAIAGLALASAYYQNKEYF